MRKIALRFDSISDREGLHDLLAKELSLPHYYGRNLDALADCLTDISEETAFAIMLPEAYEDEDGFFSYLKRTVRVFLAAEEENDHLFVFLFGEGQ